MVRRGSLMIASDLRNPQITFILGALEQPLIESSYYIHYLSGAQRIFLFHLGQMRSSVLLALCRG
jgi:hypothetical protein